MITFKQTSPNEDIVVATESVSVGEIVDAFKRFLLACGFNPDNVKEYLNDE